MRVGVDARAALAATRRGEGKALLRLYGEISRLRPDWEIFFYGYPGGQPSGIGNVQERLFDVPGFRFNLWENLALPAYARFDRLDVLHCAGSSAPRFTAGIPVVMTVHDVIPLIYSDGGTPRQVHQFERQIRYGLARASTVIAVSEATKADIVRLFDVQAEKVRVVYWGCDSAGPAPDRQKATADSRLDRLGIPRHYVMALGGGAPRKNTDRLIAAFGRVAQGIADVDLVLVGADNSQIRDRFKSLAEEAGVGDRIIILGFVDDYDLAELYDNTLCLLYPSLYEGFGLPILEAMTRGAPVIASDRSSIPEVAGSAALLIDPENELALSEALINMLSDETLRNKLAALGRERATRFSWRRTAEATADILEKTAGLK